MRMGSRTYIACVAVTAVILSLAAAFIAMMVVGAQDLGEDAELIARVTRETPESHVVITTYALSDAHRIGITVTTNTDEPMTQWGRVTTPESVNAQALGLTSAWSVPADFDREAFLTETGCQDARLVTTDTPWPALGSERHGYWVDWQNPETLIAGAFSLCLTEGGEIVHVISVWVAEGEPVLDIAALTEATVAGIVEPDPGEEPAATCEAGDDDDEFRIQIIDEDC